MFKQTYNLTLVMVVGLLLGAVMVYKSLNYSKSTFLWHSVLLSSSTLLLPDASISGSTNVCLNDTPAPQITFTGSAGSTPYTFTYTINSGANQTVSTTGTNTSVSLNVSTNTAGTFVYELISITDGAGDTSTENGTATVTVASPPSVSFSFTNNNACSGTPITFTSNVTGNGPFDYSWAFGDGSSSTATNPTHIYNAEGCGFSNFTAALTVTDANGCTATSSQVINVEQRPALSFVDLDALFSDPFNNCGNNTSDPEYTINVGNESPSASCITSYDVDFGDGTSDTNVTFPLTHTYLSLGSFNMVITANGDSGCVNTESILVKNSSNPVGAIEIPGNTVNLCLPVAPIGFAIGSWGTNPPDTIYFIDYGDGTQVSFTQAQLEASTYFNAGNPAASLNFPIPHTYTESNCPDPNYTVSLIISTSCGESLLTAGPIIILSQPNVDFDVDPIACVDTAVQFENLTVGGYNQNCNTTTVFSWDFGDGGTSSLENPTHVYTSPGTYTITLFAENFCGTTDPVSKTICIEPQLIADFTSNTLSGCAPLEINTTNTTDLTQSCGGDSYLWEVAYTPAFCGTTESWSFSNGSTETSINPSILFDSAGIYTITMTATNSCGSTTTTQAIEVKQPPTATLDTIPDACGTAAITPVATIDGCAPASETLTYNWSFPGGVPATSNVLDPGTITYAAVGTYTVTFSVTNSCGTETVTESFTVNETPVITNTDLTQTLCSGSDSEAIDITSTPNTATFNWTSNTPVGLTGYIATGTTSTIPAQTLINTTAAPVTLIYTVIPEIGACTGPPVNFEITVEPAPMITTQPLSDEVCLNGSTPDLFVDFQGSGTPNYQWYENTVDDTTTGTAIAGATSATFSPPTDTLNSIYYYVIITFSTGGCNEITSNTALIQVEVAGQIDTQPLDTQSLCVGGTASELAVVTSGGAGLETYQWFSNTTNANTGGTLIPGATASTYTPPPFTVTGTYYFYVVVSYDASGCSGLISNVSEIIVVEDPTLTSQPIASQSLCENTNAQDLEVNVTGGLGTISYQWYVNTINDTTSGTLIPGATASSYTPPTTSVGLLYYYCVITQNVSGCEVVSAIGSVEVNAGAQFTSQPISDELCLGETTSTLAVTYTNGTGTPSYQWYENTVNDTTTGTAIPGATSSTYDPPVTTVGTLYYYCIITLNAGGCSEIISAVAELIINETPSISDTSLLICSGNAFNYVPDASGGDTVPVNTMYTWTTPVINPVGSITGASVQGVPTANITQLLENTTVNPATVTYTVTPVSGDCAGEPFEVLVTVNPSITVTSAVTQNSCYQSNNASITLTIVGGVPFTVGDAYIITWSGPNGFISNDEDIFNLEAGTYILEIEDDGGCPYTETFIITEPDELVFSAIDFDPETISCFGSNDGDISISVTGGTLPYTYTWTMNGFPFSSNEDLTNLEPGLYEITVTDANNCGPILESFTIEEPPQLNVSLDSKTDIVCFGDATGAITINVTGGRPDYIYTWIGPNGFSSSSQNIDTLIAGLYSVTVTDASGCIDTLDVNVLQNDEITIDVTTTEIECYGDNDASITINTISGGIAPYDIAWSNFGTGNSQTNLSAGTYIITITDAENCVREFPVTIDEAPLFLINPVVTQLSCAGEDDASIVLNFEGGIAPITVVWNDDATAGTERNNLAPGTYTVTITDGTPCIIQESFTIFEVLPLVLSANVTHALDCDDTNSGAINLLIEGGTPPFDIVWSNGATTEDLTAIPPNTYTVQVTDANGCDIQGSWEVNRFEPLMVSVDTQTEVDCDAQTINQTFVAMASGGVPPFTYNWSSGTVSGLNNEFMTTIENGLVILEVIDSQGCTTNYSLNVETPTLGDADFTYESFGSINYGVFAIQDPIQFTNTATGDYVSVLWDFGDGSFSAEENPTHTYVSIGNYVVTQTVTYPFGCVYTKLVTLIIEEGYKLIIPDAFTPNEDSLNDYFVPKYVGLHTLKLNIYDTWGSLIYSETGDENLTGWNGILNNEAAENGNYYYTFSAKTFYDDLIEKDGVFVIIK